MESSTIYLVYGINFQMHTFFPWEEGYIEDDDLGDWWARVNGWKPTHDIYNAELKRINFFNEAKECYLKELDEWLDKIPDPPFYLLDTGGCDIMYIPDTFQSLDGHCAIALRDLDPSIPLEDKYPMTYSAPNFSIPEEAEKSLIEFCSKYGIEYDEPPQWWIVPFFI